MILRFEKFWRLTGYQMDCNPRSSIMVSRGFIISLIAFLASVYLGLNLLIRFIYPKQLFPYRGSSYAEHSDLLWAETADGNRIAMGFYPTEAGESPLILYFHGNGEDIGMNTERFQWFTEQGFNVLAIDYPGYGLSTGTPTAESVRAAADAAAQFSRDVLGFQSSETVVWGRSLGGAPAIYIASKDDFKGLILEATFRSVFSLAPPIPLLLTEPFPNEDLIEKVSAPVSIFHGQNDRVIPVSHAHALHNKTGSKANLHIFPEGQHNDLRAIGQSTFVKTLKDFLEFQ